MIRNFYGLVSGRDLERLVGPAGEVGMEGIIPPGEEGCGDGITPVGAGDGDMGIPPGGTAPGPAGMGCLDGCPPGGAGRPGPGMPGGWGLAWDTAGTSLVFGDLGSTRKTERVSSPWAMTTLSAMISFKVKPLIDSPFFKAVCRFPRPGVVTGAFLSSK